MGGGLSNPMESGKISFRGDVNTGTAGSDSVPEVDPKHPPSQKNINMNRRKNVQIFDVPQNEETVIEDEPSGGNNLPDEATMKLIAGALSGFFFLQSDGDAESNPNMNKLIRGMQREELKEGYLLIIEGESGSKLFVVESGELQVSINGEVIRSMSKGSMLGELALLYDAPRSATVKCTTDCVLWSLRREIFKRIQATSVTAHEIERSRLLINCPDLAVLSAIDLSRLVGSLESKHTAAEEAVFTENSPTSTVVLIERGSASIFTSKDLSGLSKDDIDKALSIFRPRANNNNEQRNFSKPSYSRSPSVQSYASPSGQNSKGYYACEVGPGCIIGVGALRSRANMPDSWPWVHTSDNAKEQSKSRNSHVNTHSEGALCPFTMVTNEACHYQFFTIEGFENLIGPVTKILRSGNSSEVASSINKSDAPKKSRELVFDSTKFKMKCVLGTGSFGVVLMAEYRKEINEPGTSYALKCLSKVAVVETGQLRHVLDERKILALMDSRFVLRLYGVYQTPHQLVMVTEALEYGDLWGIIYETSPFCEKGSLDKSIAVFYTACLILALDHIHRAGVVFRDLKPENILLDSNGYIRVIDFGFAKKVPYSKVDANGEEKVYSKTYTLCGTPGMPSLDI